MRSDSSSATWKELYAAAILELDRGKLSARIYAARMAIYDRIEDLKGVESMTERMALNQAIRALRELEDVYRDAPEFKGCAGRVELRQHSGEPKSAA